MRCEKILNLSQVACFTDGTDELIVGEGILREFSGFELGQEVRFGKFAWKVVGVFSTGGNVFESELWADAKVIQSLYNRGSGYQSVRAQLTSPDQLEALKQFVENDPRLNNDVTTEADYFQAQGKTLSYMAIFGRVISTVMALGALAGALNTMYTSVADRAMEIATLRAIGFSHVSRLYRHYGGGLSAGIIGWFTGLFSGLSAV